jgi:nitrate/nitrite-specific signal transduction histidine kinase
MGSSNLDTVSLLRSLAETVNAAPDYRSALRAALGIICEATGWPYGEAWVWRDSDDALMCETTWCSDPALEGFRATSSQVSFAVGSGLPGRVWRSRQPLWHPDVSVLPEEEFARCHDAERVGLHAGLGVPVIVNDEPAAVLSFFLKEAKTADWELAETVGLAASHLGMLLLRGRLEERLQTADEHLRRAASRVASLRRLVGLSERQDIVAAVKEAGEHIHAVLEADQSAIVVCAKGDSDETLVVGYGEGELFAPSEAMDALQIRYAARQPGKSNGERRTGSMLALPLTSHDDLLGGLFAARTSRRDPFSDTERAEADDFALELSHGLAQALNQQRFAKLGALGSRLKLLGELQDDVVQHLFALGLEFDAIRTEREVSGATSEAIQKGIQRVNELIAETRDYVQLLAGDDEGAGATPDLGQGLASLVQRRVPGDISVKLHLSADVTDLDSTGLGNILLIAREALDNAVEHSGTSHIAVALQEISGGRRLVIQDHGVGYNEGRVTPGAGVHAMHAAAQRLGVDLSIHSIPGMGTTVIVAFP